MRTGVDRSDVARTRERRAQEEQEPDRGDQARALLTDYVRTRDTAIRDRLIHMHEGLVRLVVNRFQDRARAAAEDLLQVGTLGLMSAIERYDPERGPVFSSFAVPTIGGYIKHYLRDLSWGITVPRHLRELGASLARRREELTVRLGRAPTVAEMAADAGVSEERLVEAMDLELAYLPLSLSSLAEDLDGEEFSSRGDLVGQMDAAFEGIEERERIQSALGCLEERLRLILWYRYWDEATQAEVGRRLGISQMHVSRLERRALSELRGLLDPSEDGRATCVRERPEGLPLTTPAGPRPTRAAPR